MSMHYKCAEENEICACNGKVSFGAGGFWAYTTISNYLTCNSAAFGGVDPNYGVAKACFCFGDYPTTPPDRYPAPGTNDGSGVEIPQALVLHDNIPTDIINDR